MTQITEPRWREVFLLTAGMTRNADSIVKLMKQSVDILLNDSTFQDFLKHINNRANSLNLDYKPAAVRAFYFELDQLNFKYVVDLAVEHMIDFDYAFEIIFDYSSVHCAIDSKLTLHCALNIIRDFEHNPDIELEVDVLLYTALNAGNPELAPYFDSDSSINSVLKCIFENCPALRCMQQEICQQFPEVSWKNRDLFQQRWQVNGETWRRKLRNLMIEHRNIGYDWQFSKPQEDLLQKYQYANKLLVDCLNSDCDISPEVRQEIEDTLLLPIAEIEQRRNSSVPKTS